MKLAAVLILMAVLVKLVFDFIVATWRALDTARRAPRTWPTEVEHHLIVTGGWLRDREK